MTTGRKIMYGMLAVCLIAAGVFTVMQSHRSDNNEPEEIQKFVTPNLQRQLYTIQNIVNPFGTIEVVQANGPGGNSSQGISSIQGDIPIQQGRGMLNIANGMRGQGGGEARLKGIARSQNGYVASFEMNGKTFSGEVGETIAGNMKIKQIGESFVVLDIGGSTSKLRMD